MKVKARREQLAQRQRDWVNLKGDGFRKRGQGGYRKPGSLKHY
jgi:hypothetical protein